MEEKEKKELPKNEDLIESIDNKNKGKINRKYLTRREEDFSDVFDEEEDFEDYGNDENDEDDYNDEEPFEDIEEEGPSEDIEDEVNTEDELFSKNPLKAMWIILKEIRDGLYTEE